MKLPSDCQVCGTTIYAEAQHCRKCGSAQDPTANLKALRESHKSGFTVATLFLVTTLLALCFAIFRAAPGLGICMCIVGFPPLLRTLLVVRKKGQMGQEVHPTAKIGLFLGSFGVTIVIMGVTLAVALLTFCFSLLGSFAVADQLNRSSPSEGILVLYAAGLTLTVVGGLLWLFFKWVRKRWKRDIAQ